MKPTTFPFTLFLCLLLTIPSLHVYGQFPGGHVTMEKCSVCGKTKQNCPYKGNHPKSQPTTGTTSSSAAIPAAIQQMERDMVFVEGGTFTMGATAEQGSKADTDEKPAHEVTLSSFRICKHEVTQAEWEAVIGRKPLSFQGEQYPVGWITWEECQKFIRKLNALTGKTYRLPTEAEWEYAARGGNRSQGYKYSGSDSLDNVGWYKENSDLKIRPVMTKSPNELGLYDMSGNVSEWCSDWYGSYSSKEKTDATDSNSERVLRGGCYYCSPIHCRVSSRHHGPVPYWADSDIGFRLAI